MKKIVYIISILTILLAFSCKTNRASFKKNNTTNLELKDSSIKNDTVRIANDEIEYEIIIIDPGFTGWLASTARPRGYYEQPYLEVKNRQWVTEWNIRAQNPLKYGKLYQMQIDYRPNIDYGYEVNYLLYNYLVYFQIRNNQSFTGVVPQY